jgi:hypothetical protein
MSVFSNLLHSNTHLIETPLQIMVFYPTAQSPPTTGWFSSPPRLPWLPSSAYAGAAPQPTPFRPFPSHPAPGGFADFMTLPRLGWAFNLLLNGASLHAQPAAPPLPGRFPCIIFSHGLGANRSTYVIYEISPVIVFAAAFFHATVMLGPQIQSCSK